MTITATAPAARSGAENPAPADDSQTGPAVADAQISVNRPFRTPGHRPSKHQVDDDRYAAMIERHIRVLGDRAAVSDASVWADIVKLKAVIDEVARDAAAKLHAGNDDLGLAPLPYSAFATELGCTAQNVYQQYFKNGSKS